MLRAEANNNGASEYAEIALTVNTRLTNVRKPATGEKTLWDPTNGWGGAFGSLVDFVATGGGASSVAISDADTTLTSTQYAKKFLVITGALSAARIITLPTIAGAMFVVRNNTTNGLPIGLKTAAGSMTQLLANGESDLVWCDGTEYRSATERYSVGAGVRIVVASYAATNADRTVVVDTSGGTRTISLPSSPRSGQMHVVMDGSGNAGSNNITIDTDGPYTINGAASVAITVGYGVKTFVFFGTGWVAY